LKELSYYKNKEEKKRSYIYPLLMEPKPELLLEIPFKIEKRKRNSAPDPMNY
jgi:hypothetical protein